MRHEMIARIGTESHRDAGGNTATPLPEKGRGSRHPEAAVLLYTLLRSRGSVYVRTGSSRRRKPASPSKPAKPSKPHKPVRS